MVGCLPPWPAPSSVEQQQEPQLQLHMFISIWSFETDAADVPNKVYQEKFKRERTSMSVVTPNTSVMKHFGGTTLKMGWNHSRPVYFINLLADPVFSVWFFWLGSSSLAGPCRTGREIYEARCKRRGKYNEKSDMNQDQY